MTKKDFELIAKAISGTRKHYGVDSKEADTMLFFAGYIAAMLLNDNPRFNYDKFVTAARQ